MGARNNRRCLREQIAPEKPRIKLRPRGLGSTSDPIVLEENAALSILSCSEATWLIMDTLPSSGENKGLGPEPWDSGGPSWGHSRWQAWGWGGWDSQRLFCRLHRSGSGGKALR